MIVFGSVTENSDPIVALMSQAFVPVSLIVLVSAACAVIPPEKGGDCKHSRQYKADNLFVLHCFFPPYK